MSCQFKVLLQPSRFDLAPFNFPNLYDSRASKGGRTKFAFQQRQVTFPEDFVIHSTELVITRTSSFFLALTQINTLKTTYPRERFDAMAAKTEPQAMTLVAREAKCAELRNRLAVQEYLQAERKKRRENMRAIIQERKDLVEVHPPLRLHMISLSSDPS